MKGSESHSTVPGSATPWTVGYQAPLSIGFSRQEYWSGWPSPSPGNLSNCVLYRYVCMHVYNWITVLYTWDKKSKTYLFCSPRSLWRSLFLQINSLRHLSSAALSSGPLNTEKSNLCPTRPLLSYESPLLLSLIFLLKINFSVLFSP